MKRRVSVFVGRIDLAFVLCEIFDEMGLLLQHSDVQWRPSMIVLILAQILSIGHQELEVLHAPLTYCPVEACYFEEV